MLSKALFAVAVMGVLSSCSMKKSGYVDMFKLVQEFELQKEYSEEAKREIDREKSMIDSIIYTVQLRDPSSSESVKNELYAALYKKTEERNKEIEKMLWKRLNPYVADFGKEKGYSYIYGANGTGNVLYADESLNVTDELIKYVNKRYHDKK
jgi:outer membrane protein